MAKVVELTPKQKELIEGYTGPMDGSRLQVKRYFSPADGNVYGSLAWNASDVDIKDEAGAVLFTQPGIEFPNEWSGLARQVVASRYFYGENGTPQRETSAGQVLSRVANKFGEWGARQQYFDSLEDLTNFRDEVAALTARQTMAFNSPVWFNVGVDAYTGVTGSRGKQAFIISEDGGVKPLPDGHEYAYPQTSACFIQGLEDTMESIMQLATNEAMLFKYGSGTGTDMSTLRSSREKLSGGGVPSGPMAYLMFWDRVAGIVKSGGKTRRAAKMNSLRVDHPDIMKFIEAKPRELEKARILIEGGIPASEALDTVAYQSANISVRATDKFMEAVLEGEDARENWQTVPVHNHDMADQMPKYNARQMLRKIAEGTHQCGDPGMQFDDTINKWHTCPNTAPIRASNPCSEYMFLNDSSCNLASLNLLRFQTPDGGFDVQGFMHAARITAYAQDLEFDNSSFPTAEIAKNSHMYRPLGQGFANLGALLMRMGLPYDSDEGRALAASIAALQTATVYQASTEMAEKVGTFEGFEANREPMLNVIRMHRAALSEVEREKLPTGLEGILDAAEETWRTVEERGEKYGFRNAQATVMAPTGTIGFMMDCDTLGIEPDLALIKDKRLAEGGMLRIVNQSVRPALERLGYEPLEIERMMQHVDTHGTLEGSGLRDEHLPVFDCALKCGDGERTIDHMGHLRMMAAVQPFMSGAISKTVNIPQDISVEGVEQAYIDAWKMGLKAVALYRDKSNPLQPLSSGGGGLEIKTEKLMHGPVRRKLPETRAAVTHKFSIGADQHEGYMIVGLYDDGSPGELFLNMNKEGSIIGGMMDAFATSVSLNLQYGVPLEHLVRKFRHQRFEPRGIVYHGQEQGQLDASAEVIHTADSIVDYVFHFMENRFLTRAQEENGGDNSPKIDITSVIANGKKSQNGETGSLVIGKGGPCPNCGTTMDKEGHCNEICPKCHFLSQNGCGG